MKPDPRTLETHDPTGSEPGPKRRALSVFIGKRHIRGNNLDGSRDKPVSSIEGESAFEWLAGEYFVYGIERVHFAGDEHITLMVFGYEDDINSYKARFSDNNGFSRDYLGQVEGDVWTFTGKLERVRMVFEQGGDKVEHFWERSNNGKDWFAICELTSVKVDQP